MRAGGPGAAAAGYKEKRHALTNARARISQHGTRRYSNTEMWAVARGVLPSRGLRHESDLLQKGLLSLCATTTSGTSPEGLSNLRERGGALLLLPGPQPGDSTEELFRRAVPLIVGVVRPASSPTKDVCHVGHHFYVRTQIKLEAHLTSHRVQNIRTQ